MRAQPVEENLRDEVLSAGSRQLAVEMEHQHRGRPGGEIEFLPLLQSRQAEGRHIGPEKAHGMGIESGDDGGAPLAARPVDRFLRHRLMAEMEAVEIAKRDDRAAQGFGHRLAMVEPPHAAASSLRS